MLLRRLYNECVWKWILENKTWLFSGAGITVFAILWWALKKVLPSGNAASPSGGSTQSNQSTSSEGNKRPTALPVPDIRPVTYRAEFAQGIGATGRSCFIMAFRNDGQAAATNVIAHIGYKNNTSNAAMLVDYGCWVEHELIMNIGRGHTRYLIIAVTEGGKNFAVNDIGPATNYTQARMVSVGEITPGEWKMVVTLSADNFHSDYVFDLIVGKDASLLCNPESNILPARR
jgi:hypothetical protein